MRKRIRSIVKRIRERYYRSIEGLNRTAERIDRNRPLVRGFYIKVGEMELIVHPRASRPVRHLYKWNYCDRPIKPLSRWMKKGLEIEEEALEMYQNYGKRN